MTLVLAACAGIVAAELIARMAAAGIHTRMAKTAGTAIKTLQRRGVSDHWKERVMLRSSRLLFTDTLRLASFFALVAVAVGAIVLLARSIDVRLLEFLVDPLGIVYVTVVAVAYLALRGRLVG